MKTIHLAYGHNLFGEIEVTLLHDALPETITVAHEDRAAIEREVEQTLVLITKTLLAKYLTVVKKTKGSYLIGDDRQRLADLNTLKSYITRKMRLVTVQKALEAHLLNISALLPGTKSRFYPSQLDKYRFFQAVTQFNPEQIEQLISSTAKSCL